MTERADVELMLAIKAGDEGAFSVLVNRHKNSIVNLTYRYLLNRADAEDIAQEVFLKVYKARKRYTPQAKFTTWLYRVAVNTSLNEIRSRKNRPTHGAAALAGADDEFTPTLQDPTAEQPVDGAERTELAELVREAVMDLPERQRTALLLNKFQGLSYEDLAETLEMTIPGIKSLLVRARENVRRKIEPYLKAGTGRRKRGTA